MSTMNTTPRHPKPLMTTFRIGGFRDVPLPYPMRDTEAARAVVLIGLAATLSLWPLGLLSGYLFDPSLLRLLIPVAWLMLVCPALIHLTYKHLNRRPIARTRWEQYDAQEGTR